MSRMHGTATRARRVLIWTENYWIGGAERFLVELLEGLRPSDTRFALAGNPHPDFDRWLRERVPWLGPRTVVPIANLAVTRLHRLDRVLGRQPPALAVPTPATAAASAASPTDPVPLRGAIAGLRYGQAALNLARLRRVLARLAPDTLLLNNGGYPGAESCRMASLAAAQLGVPRTVHFVHNMAHPRAWPGTVERHLDNRIDAAIDTWVTAAHRASDALSTQRGIPRAHVQTVHYGISVPEAWPPAADPECLRRQLGFAAGRPGLAVIANLEPRKGLDILLEALTLLAARGIELPTAVIGEGAQRDLLQKQINARGLEGSVRLLGWREDVDLILEQATMLALPSLANECLPFVILEAMGHSLPVVSTDVAGIPEMVLDGQTGRVVPPGDPVALADALAQVASAPDLAAAMGKRGHARVRAEFSRERMVGAMAALLGL